MIKASFITNFNRLPELEKRMKFIQNQSVSIGWFAEQGTHPSERSEVSFAQLAAIHHYGVPKFNIPPRPVLAIGLFSEQVSGFKSVLMALRKYSTNVKATRSLGGANLMLTEIGRKLVSNLKPLFGIASGAIPSNAASTVELKGSNSPLIETGELMMALTAKTSLRGLI